MCLSLLEVNPAVLSWKYRGAREQIAFRVPPAKVDRQPAQIQGARNRPPPLPFSSLSPLSSSSLLFSSHPFLSLPLLSSYHPFSSLLSLPLSSPSVPSSLHLLYFFRTWSHYVVQVLDLSSPFSASLELELDWRGQEHECREGEQPGSSMTHQ